MAFEITIPNVPNLQLEVIVPDSEYDLIIEPPAVLELEVNTLMSLESTADYSLIYNIAKL